MKKGKISERRIAMIRDYQASGLSQSAYARKHGLSLSTIQYWLRKVNSHTDEKRPVREWIPIQVSAPDTIMRHMEISYPDGTTVRIPLG
jgi:transposase-like protein